MFLIWYVIALVVSLVATCYVDKVNHGQVTVGDFLLNLLASICPITNFVVAMLYTLVVLTQHTMSSDFLKKKLF
jgi:hypothetical protein